jgi:hypothetical protein
MGSLPPEERNTLRAKALAEIPAAVARLPEVVARSFTNHRDLHDFFNYWLEHELTQLSRKLRIVQAQRQGKLLKVQIAGLGKSLDEASASDALLAKPFNWAVFDHDVDLVQSEQKARELLQVIEDRTLPLLHVLHPNLLDEISSKDGTVRFIALEELNEVATINKNLAGLTQAILNGVQNYRADRVTTPFTLVLRYPRPIVYDAGHPEGTPNTIFSELPGRDLPMASIGESRALWEAVDSDSSEKFGVHLSPATLYRGRGESSFGRLACNTHSPVIESMAVLARMKPQYGLNSQLTLGRWQNLWFPGLQSFTSPAGLITFQLPQTQTLPLPLIFMNHPSEIETQVLPLMGSRGEGSAYGKGFSPFGELKINPQELRTDLLTKARSQFGAGMLAPTELIKEVFDDLFLVAQVRATQTPDNREVRYPEKCVGALQ